MRHLRLLGAGVLGVFALAGPAARAEAPKPPTDPTALVDQLLGGILGDLDEKQLTEAVEKVGGLRFRRPVTLDFLDRPSLERYLREVADEEYPEARAHADRRLLVGGA